MAVINLGPCACCGGACTLRNLGYTEAVATLNASFLFASPQEDPDCGIINRALFSDVCSSLNGTYVFELPEQPEAAPPTFSALEDAGVASAYDQYSYGFQHDLTVSVSCTEAVARVRSFYKPGVAFFGDEADHIVRYAFYDVDALPTVSPLLVAGKHYFTGVVSVEAIDEDSGLYKTVERYRNFAMTSGSNLKFWLSVGRCSFLPTALYYYNPADPARTNPDTALGPRVLDDNCVGMYDAYHPATPFDANVLSFSLQ